ncbi:MAG: type II toxin-antitoxin system VapC family toxin [Spirochaetaceae bacterium]|nr:type II toxin-antitoxin system VapC family toxin [Spirochaetaceae bacterium]
MKILCDTHIIIWYLTGDNRLSQKARELIDDERNTIYFSIVSIWEVSIKHNRKPDKLTLSAQEFTNFCDEQGFIEYPLNQQHIFMIDTLTRPANAPEHHDPFDRLLISQAKSDGLTFITHDSLIPYYNEPCIMPV